MSSSAALHGDAMLDGTPMAHSERGQDVLIIVYPYHADVKYACGLLLKAGERAAHRDFAPKIPERQRFAVIEESQVDSFREEMREKVADE